MKLTKEEAEMILDWYNVAEYDGEMTDEDYFLKERVVTFISGRCSICDSPQYDHKKRHQYK